MQPSSTSHYVKDPEKEVRVRTLSYLPPAGFKMGSAPDELYAAFGVMHPNFDSLNEILEKTPTTLGGQPALKLVTRPIDLTAGVKLSDNPEFAKDQLERRAENRREEVDLLRDNARPANHLRTDRGPLRP